MRGLKRRSVGVAAAGLLAAVLVVGLVALAPPGLAERLGVERGGTARPLALPVPLPAETVVAEPLADPSADPGKVAAALAGPLTDAALGTHVAVLVADDDGTELFRAGDVAAIPASTTKLLSGFAALAALGPEHTFTTRVVRLGNQVVLVGGGDPLFSRAQLVTLAEETAAALKSANLTSVELGYDTSLFQGAETAATWKASYVTSRVVSPIISLWFDDGRTDAAGRVISKVPAAQVAEQFAVYLAQRGVTATTAPSAVVEPAGAELVASVESADLAQLLKHTIERSDNDAAEVLARHVALERGEVASFEGAASAVIATLVEQGIGVDGLALYDGSGLSRSNRIPVAALIDILRKSDADPRLRDLVHALPVAGFTGTVAGRFDDAPAGLGAVRAKTGSLNNVRSLAGTATTADGAQVYFAVLADAITLGAELTGQDAVDRLVGALAACTCR